LFSSLGCETNNLGTHGAAQHAGIEGEPTTSLFISSFGCLPLHGAYEQEELARMDRLPQPIATFFNDIHDLTEEMSSRSGCRNQESVHQTQVNEEVSAVSLLALIVEIVLEIWGVLNRTQYRGRVRGMMC
jgi:hypothetical protein